MTDPRLARIFAGLTRLLPFLLLPVIAIAQEPTIRHYDWLTADKVSGSHVLEIRADGKRVADFEFNDRGRGPKIHEEAKSDETGMLTALQVSGHSYMGAPVDESFSVENGKARWKSTLEEGEAAAGQGYYSANDGSPEQFAMMARALLASPAGELNLLPAGKASIQKVTDEVITHAEQEQRVSLYAISGLSFTPQYLWLDADNELFTIAMGWMGLTPRGFHQVLPRLQEIQDRAEQDYHRQLAEKLTNKLPAEWILRNVSIVNVESGTLSTGQLVAVSNGKIVKIMDNARLKPPAADDTETRIIDGQGLVLIPGLWDMHTHLSLEAGLMHIAAGVSTVRDLANDPVRLKSIRQLFDSGEVIGPRSFTAGFIDKKSPYSAPTGRLAQSLDDALVMVREYAEMGYPQVKIYSSIEPEWVKPIAEEVHKNGMRLSGHIPSYMTASQAVNDGFDEIQHINMLFLNFLAGPEDDTRTPLRFSLVAEKAGDMDLDSPSVNTFIEQLKKKGIVVDPTVTIFDGMFRHRSGELNPEYAMIADHMPPSVRRSMLGGEMDINDSNAARYARSADALLEMIAKLHKAGVPLVAGTDDMAGFTLHRELELYHRAGISTADVLRIATLGSARVAGVADQTGSISEGKQADFVLIEGNPLENISAVRKPVAVFKGDRWFDPAQLYEAIGIKPFTR